MPTDFIVRFVLAALVCFRLAELIAVDDGPGDVFMRLRIRAGSYDRDEQGRIKTGTGRLLACPYCLGIWWALAFAVWLDGISAEMAVVWFALAGAQAFLETIGGRT